MSAKKLITLKNTVTKYNPIQDRICIAGTFSDHGLISAWLSQRFLKNFIPKLYQKIDITWIDQTLEKEIHVDSAKESTTASKIEMVKDFVDELGEQNIQPLLITGFRTKKTDSHLIILFDTQDDPRSLIIPLTQKNIKKWLNILYRQSLRGGWSRDIWPSEVIAYLAS